MQSQLSVEINWQNKVCGLWIFLFFYFLIFSFLIQEIITDTKISMVCRKIGFYIDSDIGSGSGSGLGWFHVTWFMEQVRFLRNEPFEANFAVIIQWYAVSSSVPQQFIGSCECTSTDVTFVFGCATMLETVLFQCVFPFESFTTIKTFMFACFRVWFHVISGIAWIERFLANGTFKWSIVTVC